MTEQTNNFEKASRLKLRFDTNKHTGLTVEDLWDMPLESKNNFSLDALAVELHNKVNDSTTTSFIGKTTDVNKVIKLKFDIVKHIIDTKLAEREARKNAAASSDKRKYIDDLIAAKQIESDKDKSLEELIALRDSI
jgi:transcription initiation factor IIF auxiliary subunit